MILSEEVLNRAKRKAAQSPCRYQVCAIGFSKEGKTIAFGMNRPRFSRFSGGRHAEMVALEKGGTRIKSMIICRIGATGKLLPIHCCNACQRILNRHNIKVYTAIELLK
jgi:hypothetical protein